MKLYWLLKNINGRVLGNTNLDISGLFHKDTEVKENGLFFCLRGTKVDGVNFVVSAIKNGAVAVVTEQEIPGIVGTTQIIVKNARETMSLIACRFFNNPANKLKIIAVTGTNGKTTIANITAKMLSMFGKKVAEVGTNGIVFSNKVIETGLTTPDPIELQKYFAQMVKEKVEYVVMEVSAHALDLFKVSGFVFKVSIFTNLTEDHLDYFKNMEKYFLAKSKLFTKKHSQTAIVCVDDSYGNRLAESINIPKITYSISRNVDCFATEISSQKSYQSFKFNNDLCVQTKLLGRFNVSNILAMISTVELCGFDQKEIISKINKLEPVSGRFNILKVKDSQIVIDYAHTPDGLQNILCSCRELAGDAKVISVFGCGGNRETQKRRVMGEISSKYADFSIITSDNPRFESREAIAKEVASGMTGSSFMIELDRAKAIEKAINMADENDVVLIAGKGAENYIEEKGVKIPYSDYAEVEKYRRV